MDNQDINQDCELLALRAEYSSLKKSIDRQMEINNHIIKDIIKNRSSSLQRQLIENVIMAAIGVGFTIFLRISLGVSEWICVAGIFYFLIPMLVDIFLSFQSSASNILTKSTVEACELMVRIRRVIKVWPIFYVPVAIAFIYYLLKEFSVVAPAEAIDGIYIGAMVGGAFGVILGVYKYIKMLTTTKEIISSLKSLKETEGK